VTRKKVLLVGPPFSGHWHPLLGIGRRLKSIADVVAVSTPGGVATAATAGLQGQEILAAQEKAVWEITDPGRNVKGNPILLYRQLKAHVALLAGLKAELDAVFDREKPDLVIADFTVAVAGICAREHGIPWWTTLPAPCVFETPDGPPAYFGGLGPATTRLHELTHSLLRGGTRLFKRTMWLLFQREFSAIGFNAIYRADGSEAVYSTEHIFALGIPEIEFVRTYPPHFQLIGPVLYTPPDRHMSPPSGGNERTKVLVTIGTHLAHEKAAMVWAIRQIAFRHPEIDFHFSHGDAASEVSRVQGNFHEYGYVSYARHLLAYDLVVHHAGSGVLNYCLRHGKPAVLYPLDFDHFDNAERLVAARLAIRAKNLAELEAKILQGLADTAMRERCRAMSVVHGRYEAEESIVRLVAAL
jgi:UDP:flavonoid glycosyltransferase YjiC (YdhE family)